MKRVLTPYASAYLAAACGLFAAQTAHAADATEAQLAAAFKAADADSDGTVTWAEAKKFGLHKKLFKHADGDKEGTLDQAEFTAALKAQFEGADPDKDSTLDAKEAGKAGVGKKLFTAADPDKDTTIDFSEYVVHLTQKATSK